MVKGTWFSITLLGCKVHMLTKFRIAVQLGDALLNCIEPSGGRDGGCGCEGHYTRAPCSTLNGHS